MAATALIDYRSIGWGLGGFMAALGGAMLVPLAYAAIRHQPDTGAFLWGAGITLATAMFLLAIGYRRPRRELRPREAILLVVLAWVGTCVFGGLPLWFTPAYASFTDAVFESTSGFTTTGATVIADVEILSRPVHLWRCFSHWLGGMGIILLGLAVLPLLGQGGNVLYRAEFSGSSSERLRPRVLETARSLWRIYVLLTLLELLSLVAAGMDGFEALCHAFSTLGTGGFSTRSASIAGFDSPLIEYIVILFMLLGGISFVQHYRLFVDREPGAVLGDYEVRGYVAITVVATLVIGASLFAAGGGQPEPVMRAAMFQVVSILTTTGFATADYETWQPLAQLVLVVLMFIGGCTGSTAGGLKVARVRLLVQLVRREFRRVTEPLGVFRIRAGSTVVPDHAICGLLNLVVLALLLTLAAGFVLTATGVDLVTALSAVVACQFNVGPGLGSVGPTGNYGGLVDVAKWTLTLCMIAGRLEFYTFLVVMTSVFWRR
jgi:trk system potassium uptake protein TrkH